MENGKNTLREIDVTKMTGPQFAIELMGVPAPAILIYHRGNLALTRKAQRGVNELANEAMSLWKSGWVCLTQRRIRGHEGQFEYYAVKRAEVGAPKKLFSPDNNAQRQY